MAEKQVYPRIPESNWWVLRDQFSRTMPTVVNVSYLKSLLRLATEAGARNLIPPLKQLTLIDEDGKPTSIANDWRSNARYADACRQIIENVYPEQLRSLYSGKNIDKNAVVDWFKYTAEQGEGTANMSAAMYILLNEATPKSSEDFKKKPKVIKLADAKKTTNGKATSDPLPILPQADVMPEKNTSNQDQTQIQKKTKESNLSLHIDLQIHISPDATPEQIDQIFSSIARHLNISANNGE